MANWTVANRHGKIAQGYHAIHSEADPSNTEGLAHLPKAADRAFPNNAPHKWVDLDNYYNDHMMLEFMIDHYNSDPSWFKLIYFCEWRGKRYTTAREAISVAMADYSREQL